MKLINTYETIVKKSKFIGYYYSLDDIQDVDIILNNLASEHKKARHIPYAYKVNNTASKSDDKEPTNTAGLPLYNLIERKELDNILIAVVRYFGGTKLGAGNLLRAYLESANKAIEKMS